MTQPPAQLSTVPEKVIHILSDSTGETVVKSLRACLVQFPNQPIRERLWTFVRSKQRLDEILQIISTQRGLVVFTLVDEPLRQQLINYCQAEKLAYLSILDPIITCLEDFLGAQTEHQPGRQYILDEAYFKRINAVEFAVNHDDGQGLSDIHNADVIILGPSRMSKTPTCIYLAYRGLKAANVPLVKDRAIPDEVLYSQQKALIVGLSHDAQHLQDIRRHRLGYLHNDAQMNYVDLEYIEEEIRQAKRLYRQYGWPTIDTTRRSIEETAARIIQLLDEFKQ
jgi:regulator of PEP synthase PpsR (kinase-PPPase family)